MIGSGLFEIGDHSLFQGVSLTWLRPVLCNNTIWGSLSRRRFRQFW
jgi:hypothetical protein